LGDTKKEKLISVTLSRFLVHMKQIEIDMKDACHALQQMPKAM